jgi:hypothetical protein
MSPVRQLARAALFTNMLRTIAQKAVQIAKKRYAHNNYAECAGTQVGPKEFSHGTAVQ